MSAIKDRFAAHPNGYGSRKGVPVDLVILHTVQGTAQAAIQWFRDPAAKVSAHYVVGASGLTYECVPEEFACWAAGNIAYNRRSVQIECAGYAEDPATWTDAMVDAVGQLVGEICVRHDIPPDRAHIIGHVEVPSPDGNGMGGAGHHTDPGPHCPWTLIVDAAKRVVDAAVSARQSVV